MTDWYRWDGEDLLLAVHLQPKASKDEFAGLHGDRLKIRLTAPPVEGKANAHLMAFLAKAFGVPNSPSDFTKEKIIAWCRDNMANYTVPREVEVVDVLPRNAMGKLQKFLLRERAAAG